MPIEPSAGPVQSEVQSSQDAATTPDSVPTPVVAAAGVAPPGYELFEEIGRGGMGVVYRARDLALNREVAVKILQEHFAPDSSAAARFAAEAQITGQLQHPGIPAIYQVGQLPDCRPYLAMKLIKGKTLDTLLKIDPKLDYLPVIEAIAQAVGYAHAHQVIHRDLKPANVMVGSFGEVQVMDWGLAKVQTANKPPKQDTGDPNATTPAATEIRSLRASDGEFTHAGSILGTPNYMAPEQAAGELDKVDARADVFGLGGILCVLLTGKPPFGGKDAESVRLNAVRGKTEEAFTRLEASGAEPAVIALCKRCLAFEPDERPENGQVVATIVATLRREAEERARQAELDKARAEVQVAEQRKRRLLLLRAGGTVAAVLVLGIIGTTLGLIQAQTAKEAERQRADVEEIATREARAAEKHAEERRIQAEAATAAESKAKGEAQAAETRAEERRVQAEAATTTARQRFVMALDAFEMIVFGIQNKLENRPGTLELRKDLLQNARAGLHKLLKDAEKQDNPDHTLVISYLRLGDVELVLGNTLAAQKEYQNGHDLAQKLADADPTNAEAQRDLSLSFINLGDVTFKLGPTKEALQFYQKALTVRQRLADADNNPPAQRDLSISYERLGDVTLQLGQPKEALAFYQKYNESSQRLADADPKDARAQRELSISFNKLGDVNLQLGQTMEALGLHKKALTVRQRLADADPKNAQTQRELSISFDRLGDLTRLLGQTKEALVFYQKFNEISQRLADADPKDARAQRDLSVSFNKLGDVNLQLEQSKEALEFYQKGVQSRQQLADADPMNAEAQRDLSVSFDRLGEVMLQLGQAKEAQEFFQKGLTLRQRLVDADPKNAVAQRDLSISFIKLGDVEMKLGRTKETLELYEKSNRICQRLADADLKNAVAQRDLGITFNKLGDVTWQLGQTKKALEFYQKGLDVSLRLTEADPQNIQAQTDLFISYFKLGAVEKRRHEYARAADYFDKGRTVLLPWHEKKLLLGQLKNAVARMEREIATCRIADKALADLDFVLKQPAAQVPGLLDLRVRAFTARNDRQTLVATAEAYEKLAAKDNKQVYNAACAWSLASGLAKNEAKLQQEYTIKAMTLLKKTPTGTGHFFTTPAKLAAHMKQDKDLDPLRDREDFQKFLKELETAKD